MQTPLHENKTYLVVGLGRFGTALCRRLTESGAHVIAVDHVKSRVDELAESLEFVAQIDATDEASLLKIGAKDADVAIVCLGERAEATILVTAILIELGIPKVVARASDELQARILSKVGAHEVVFPEAEMGRRTADVLTKPWMSSFTSLGDDNHLVGKLKAPQEMAGKSLKELALPNRFGTMIIAIEREGRNKLPHADFVLGEGDTLWLFGEKTRMTPLLETIKTEESE